MIVINAENLIIGRVATYAAKQALLGEEVKIINSEKAVVTGRREVILENYKHRVERGDPHKGPYYPRTAERILRRTIRGMLPYKQSKGKEAFKRIRCFIGIPEVLKNEKPITLEKANISKTKSLRYMSLAQISMLLRGK